MATTTPKAPAGRYVMPMTLVRNPDFFREAPVPLLSPVVADSPADCAAAFVAARDAHGFGAGNMGRHCGCIYSDTGALVGRVSYNGRLWPVAVPA